MVAFSSARDFGPESFMAWIAASGLRFCGIVASCSIILSTLEAALRTRPGIACASGMLRQ